MSGLLRSSYDYPVIITHVRDADSHKGILDYGFGLYRGNFDPLDDRPGRKVEFRQYGYNGNEITKRGGKSNAHVGVGYDHRDAFLTSLHIDPLTIPRKAKFHPVPWRHAVIQSIWDDEWEKYGRVKSITHYAGVNTNETMRDVIGGVEFYDGKIYPPDYPIRPPQ